MTTSEFAALKGCSRRTVLRAIEEGRIPEAAVRRRGASGRRQQVEIVDVALASRYWEPSVRVTQIMRGTDKDKDKAPTVLPSPGFASIEEELKVKRVSGVANWGWALGSVASTVMAIPKLARQRIRGLPAGAEEILAGLCSDALICILPDTPSDAEDVLGWVADAEEIAIVEKLLRERGCLRKRRARS